MTLRRDELTQAMMDALSTEWQKAKGSALPGAGLEDRRLIFAAVAGGLLNYLEAKQHETVKTIDLEEAGTSTRHRVTDLDLDIESE